MEEHGSFGLVLACGIYFYLLHFIPFVDRERSLPQQQVLPFISPRKVVEVTVSPDHEKAPVL